jgi:hypothetical protein
MALRERKAAKLSTPEEEEDKPVSRVNRRKTVAGSAVLATEKVRRILHAIFKVIQYAGQLLC